MDEIATVSNRDHANFIAPNMLRVCLIIQSLGFLFYCKINKSIVKKSNDENAHFSVPVSRTHKDDGLNLI